MYVTLFVAALLSATLLPGSSEVLLATLQTQGYAVGSLWLVATLGNTLGSCVNYALGRYALHWQHHRWFPVSPTQLEKGQAWFGRYGKWSLLLAWLPVVGDPITLFAGIMRLHLGVFLILTAIGKAARYAVILGLLLSIS
ncbi:YqaA family protein [Pseudidiomarina andamanensis]|uniref:DedA family protein n=1 Tax=Pseudidiomarina andamanensis TaxID=1940690 RepID=A0AA92ETR9_9GAMM|nr:YqaA family protein [Pseudidiomarina andamanensis]MDS0219045.1 DedA family protein [Pseudidiomarina andamanensis]QGT96397.1 DedA family protein [Pseudidiomarina andamanensis]